MSALAATRLNRMGRCESDLARNGIDLLGAGERAMRLLVRRHLDYFQLMLGYDAGPREVIALAKRLSSERNGGAQIKGDIVNVPNAVHLSLISRPSRAFGAFARVGVSSCGSCRGGS